ncbi:MAG: DNA polymerase III subunit delta [Treponema succinifaciens]|uniref:DNA polymerase III subunit delta n=1 Tax=Treponema succinifaciens TaxID=167 RepID=UPI002357B73B|nr:DNA polymerase III subunit delta [Treponema succinifaciens]MCI6911588.1 DNA polymerase III subunit delta [Treponema succinifaciens]MDD6962147.1 DNA polymerase III subunit delta [Treponema succinifaciens]MDY5116866.1 DNA polymerase III subunit delta [Treponema succinifaciens]
MAETEVYLFTGPEAGEKNEAIENLRDAASKKNNGIEQYKYYAADVRIEDIVAQLQNASLFSPALFISLRNAEQIKQKSDIESLVSWIKASKNSPNTLVLISEENSIDKKIESAVPSSHKKIFWEMFENRKPQWVENFFRKNGFSISPDAVEQILEMVENNTESLKSECSRFFFCFEKGTTITSDDVEKILSHNREENAFTLFDSMADISKNPQQRFESSLEILQKIRATKESNGIALIAGLTYCFRQLRLWHSLHSDGKSPADSELKSSGFSGKRNQEKYSKAAKIWTAGTTSSILALLSATDISIRETGTALEETYLYMLIYSIVIKNGLFCSVCEY